MRRIARRPAAFVVGSIATIALVAVSLAATSLEAAGTGPATASRHPSPTRADTAAPTVRHHPVGSSGRWKVAANGRSTYRVTWTSPTRLPHSDARPEILADGHWAGPATISADGRRVSAIVTSGHRPAAVDVDVLLGGTILDQQADAGGPAPSPSPSPSPFERPSLVSALADDPGVRGSHRVAIRTYALKPVKLPDIPALSEMVGHVVAPTDATDSSPLVVFLHGRHMSCYSPAPNSTPLTVPLVKAPNSWHCPAGEVPVPSYLGYNYVQRRLATQGYVTVSISADAVNDLDYLADDAGSAARAALIRHHLDAWATFVAHGDEHADLDNVILVGHSRGGEGANRASLNLPTGAG
ncbi:MAG TPA: hypothetical protein VLK34_05120, partial [Nocardioidaceae bacterium]|nr:hypothetical protein [Nocardioidaceae bacterium]